MSDDFNPATRIIAETFLKLHELIGGGQFRGYPPRVASATVKRFDKFVDGSQVTWESTAELGKDRSWLPADISENQVPGTIKALVETIETLIVNFGRDRVRLIFTFL